MPSGFITRVGLSSGVSLLLECTADVELFLRFKYYYFNLQISAVSLRLPARNRAHLSSVVKKSVTKGHVLYVWARESNEGWYRLLTGESYFTAPSDRKG